MFLKIALRETFDVGVAMSRMLPSPGLRSLCVCRSLLWLERDVATYFHHISQLRDRFIAFYSTSLI